jgi:hypothetical protein
MSSLPIRLSLLAATVLAISAWFVVPQGIQAGRWLAAEDDPVRIADLALEKSFHAAVAEREIAAALAAKDIDLAESFVALADARGPG